MFTAHPAGLWQGGGCPPLAPGGASLRPGQGGVAVSAQKEVNRRRANPAFQAHSPRFRHVAQQRAAGSRRTRTSGPLLFSGSRAARRWAEQRAEAGASSRERSGRRARASTERCAGERLGSSATSPRAHARAHTRHARTRTHAHTGARTRKHAHTRAHARTQAIIAFMGHRPNRNAQSKHYVLRSNIRILYLSKYECFINTRR